MSDRSLAGSIFITSLLGVCAYNTVLNNAYAYGATLFDSTIFGTIIWRTDWLLHPAGVFGPLSYFDTHISPINYLPNILSYLFPGDRMTYYGLVYGAVYAALGLTTYRLIVAHVPQRAAPWLASLGALALFCSQTVFEGQWEPHIEVASPIFFLLLLRAWQLRHYRSAIFWLVLNAAIREDLGVVYAMPIGLLATAQYFEARSQDAKLAQERLRWGLSLVTLSVALSVIAFAVQRRFFPGVDVLNTFYFDADHPFQHISGRLLLDRARFILTYHQGLWLPVLAIMIAGALFRDRQLLVGAFAFAPYFLINFISKMDLSATFGSYKSFPLAVVMLWPTVIAMGRQNRARRLCLVLQAVVFTCGLIGVQHSQITFMGSGGLEAAAARWLPQPLADNAEAYSLFGIHLKQPTSLGLVRASQGVIALYPYDFGIWYESNFENLGRSEIPKVDTLIWFDGDRDSRLTHELVNLASLPYRYRVVGTAIELATRVPPEQFVSFNQNLQRIAISGQPLLPQK